MLNSLKHIDNRLATSFLSCKIAFTLVSFCIEQSVFINMIQIIFG